MDVRIGLQTITWGDPQNEIMDEVLSSAARSGYDGVEIGWRRIAATGVERLGSLLTDNGLQLLGSHAGGNLVDARQAESERRQIDCILDAIVALDAPLLMYSGLKYQDKPRLSADIDMLNATARRCRESGVSLLYHNHDFEFDHDGAVFDALIHETTGDVGFCPDVGWLYKTGRDCIDVLEVMRDRLQAVHFKDFRSADPHARDFCCLGEGEVPLEQVAEWIKALPGDEIWVTAEQDTHDGPPAEAVYRNAEFMKRCFG
jgi:sugar phosphate isomerase/epimerase